MNPHLNFALHFQSKKWAPFIYELSKKMQEGHICIDIQNDLSTETTDTFAKLPFVIQDNNNVITSDGGNLNVPFIIDKNLLYFQRYYKYEISIFSFLQQRISSNIAIHAAVDFLKKNTTFLPSLINEDFTIDYQALAIVNSFLHDFSIITGGPGTGKTTTVTKLLHLCLQYTPHARIAVAAPTGKASSKLLDSIHTSSFNAPDAVKQGLLNTKGFTIHRLLGYQPDSIYFKHNSKNVLPYDIIIIDECSMIDIALFSKLLNAIDKHCKLILVGDKNQLASIEAGSIFGDICNSQSSTNTFTPTYIESLKILYPSIEAILNRTGRNTTNSINNYIVELTKSYRFNDQEGIGILSKAVIENDTVLLDNLINQSNQQFCFALSANDTILNSFIDKYAHYIHIEDTALSLAAFNRLKILCATKEGPSGIHQINNYVANYLEKKGWLQQQLPFYHNMPIMITQNNYALNLFNGDIGIIRRDTNNQLQAYFLDNQTGKTVSYSPNIVGQFEIAFAMTIHKSQGSEFEEVLMIINPSTTQNNLLSRELVYTGITRAKKFIQIITTSAVIRKACATKVLRSSGLSSRLG